MLFALHWFLLGNLDSKQLSVFLCVHYVLLGVNWSIELCFIPFGLLAEVINPTSIAHRAAINRVEHLGRFDFLNTHFVGVALLTALLVGSLLNDSNASITILQIFKLKFNLLPLSLHTTHNLCWLKVYQWWLILLIIDQLLLLKLVMVIGNLFGDVVAVVFCLVVVCRFMRRPNWIQICGALAFDRRELLLSNRYMLDRLSQLPDSQLLLALHPCHLVLLQVNVRLRHHLSLIVPSLLYQAKLLEKELERGCELLLAYMLYLPCL